jgi:putative membrane protein
VVDFTGGFSGMWIMALISGLMGLVITVGLIALIVLGIRWFLRQERGSLGGSGGAPRADDSLEVLRRRYAAGEIDDEEYERRRRTLAG